MSAWRSALLFVVTLFLGLACVATAGPYTDSAHGNSATGVSRTDMAAQGYVKGNCAHCHEMHASINGQEPAPASGSPSPAALFADNFSGVTVGPYIQSDNFCFYCHTSFGAVQVEGAITNEPYSNTFGGYNIAEASDILGTFNLSNSYHNLYDVQRFAKNKFSFFKDSSNPCVACHNPHLAKRNKEHPADPTFTAISRPTDHENLWGDDVNERMSNYISYRSPYSFGSTSFYEPDGSTSSDGSLVPDYNAFCLDCHREQVPTTQSVSRNPETPAGFLTAINWSGAGDIHGARARYFQVDGSDSPVFRTNPDLPPGSIIAPYDQIPVQGNYVLSCLDCHEPHGSYFTSSYLLRRVVNGGVVGGSGPPSGQVIHQQDFCQKCHTDNHCGGPNGCFTCHYHGSRDKGCAGPWDGATF